LQRCRCPRATALSLRGNTASLPGRCIQSGLEAEADGPGVAMPRIGDVPVIRSLVVDSRKVTHYLFALDHARGGPKGRFFLLFGFSVADPQGLADALLAHGLTYQIDTVDERADATVYTVVGEISSPDGRNPRIRTVWQNDRGTSVARFITTVPMPRGRE